MAYKRVLTIQDISCIGQCSLTVALPIISACGVETCIVPSAVLSSHTGGFKSFSFRDLTEDMTEIRKHWVNNEIKFDAIYTGYLGSKKQISYVEDFFKETANESCMKIVDPAMADHGKLYVGFDDEFVEAMKSLCVKADYILPNITEACLLTGTEYKEVYDRDFVDELLMKLRDMGCKNIIFTGISYAPEETGIVIFEDGEYSYYQHEKLEKSCHGTGDIYASAFTGSLMRGKRVKEAAKIAADFVLECMKETAKHENHWYGATFEPVLYKLALELNK